MGAPQFMAMLDDVGGSLLTCPVMILGAPYSYKSRTGAEELKT